MDPTTEGTLEYQPELGTDPLGSLRMLYEQQLAFEEPSRDDCRQRNSEIT